MAWHKTMRLPLAEPYLLYQIMSEKPSSGPVRLQLAIEK